MVIVRLIMHCTTSTTMIFNFLFFFFICLYLERYFTQFTLTRLPMLVHVMLIFDRSKYGAGLEGGGGRESKEKFFFLPGAN